MKAGDRQRREKEPRDRLRPVLRGVDLPGVDHVQRQWLRTEARPLLHGRRDRQLQPAQAHPALRRARPAKAFCPRAEPRADWRSTVMVNRPPSGAARTPPEQLWLAASEAAVMLRPHEEGKTAAARGAVFVQHVEHVPLPVHHRDGPHPVEFPRRGDAVAQAAQPPSGLPPLHLTVLPVGAVRRVELEVDQAQGTPSPLTAKVVCRCRPSVPEDPLLRPIVPRPSQPRWVARFRSVPSWTRSDRGWPASAAASAGDGPR